MKFRVCVRTGLISWTRVLFSYKIRLGFWGLIFLGPYFSLFPFIFLGPSKWAGIFVTVLCVISISQLSFVKVDLSCVCVTKLCVYLLIRGWLLILANIFLW